MSDRRRRYDRNGGEWRKLRAAVLRSEDLCALCGRPVDKSLPYLHPLSAQVDHIIPVALGGAIRARANLQLAHRSCNRRKGTGVGTEATPPMPTSRPW